VPTFNIPDKPEPQKRKTNARQERKALQQSHRVYAASLYTLRPTYNLKAMHISDFNGLTAIVNIGRWLARRPWNVIKSLSAGNCLPWKFNYRIITLTITLHLHKSPHYRGWYLLRRFVRIFDSCKYGSWCEYPSCIVDYDGGNSESKMVRHAVLKFVRLYDWLIDLYLSILPTLGLRNAQDRKHSLILLTKPTSNK